MSKIIKYIEALRDIANKIEGYKGPAGKGKVLMHDGLGSGPGGMGLEPPGTGPGKTCVCPKCGFIVDHGKGFPCIETMCPNCKKSNMIKAGGK